MAPIALAVLEPQFVRVRLEGGREYHEAVERLADAQGIRFLCPKCFQANGGAVGTHLVVCWSRSRGAPDRARPGPGRWRLKGSSYGDLTLKADAPSNARSVQLTSGCQWHGFVTDGIVTSC